MPPLHTNWGGWHATSCSCATRLHVPMNVDPGRGCFWVCMWPQVPVPLACKRGQVTCSLLFPRVHMCPLHANQRGGGTTSRFVHAPWFMCHLCTQTEPGAKGEGCTSSHSHAPPIRMSPCTQTGG